MKLSIVTTLYHSAAFVQEFYKRIKKSAEKITQDYEIIFVDDGSPDNSLEIAIDLARHDEKIIVMELSRNFGHHKAIMTGLTRAKGDLVFLIDVDLEEAPELLELFFQQLNQKKSDVVYGVQKQRKGKWFERITGSIFYFLVNLLTSLNIKKNLVTARLMTKTYVRSLIRHHEREIFLAGLWQITGYKQTPILIDKGHRSNSTYDFYRKYSILLNSITSFSNKPLLYIFYFGLVISLLAFSYILYLLIEKIIFATPLAGWSSLIVSIWFLGGIIILFIGVIGIYISKIFMETKHRPYTIVKQIHQIKKA